MKRTLHQLLSDGNLEEIAELAVERKRVLGSLISLTYDADPLISWRAVESIGMAAQTVVEHDPDAVKELLRRLYWLITEESGGICWRAPEAMAEVSGRLPAQFGEYIPITVHLLLEFAEEDLQHFRPGCIWAIGRLSSVAGEYTRDVLPAVIAGLEVTDPQARGMAVWCLGEFGELKSLSDRPKLLSDKGPVAFYENRSLEKTTVGDLTHRVLAVTA